MLRKKKFLIGGLVLALALGYLSYTGFMGSATYYYTVTELTERAGSLGGTSLRVSGVIDGGSVKREAGGNTLKFNILESGKSLPVVYQGTVPDAFKAGNEVVVEGILNSAGVFEANTILTKCASKYEPE